MKKLLVVGFAALLLVAFTAPAMAKVDIGGIIFTDFYYFKQDKENKGDGDSYSATKIQVPQITRLRLRWTNETGVGMYIEFGLGDAAGGASGSGGAMLRHAYGWWDVNPSFTLMVGHSTTPFSPLTPSQLLGYRSPGGTHVIGIGFGEYYSGRFPQVRGTFKFSKNARLAVALIDPIVTASPFTPASTFVSDNDSMIPRIDIGLPLYFGNVKLYPGVFYHTQTFDNVAGGDDSIDAWGASIGVTAGFGPLSIKGEFNMGENWGNSRGSAEPTGTLAGGATAFVSGGQVYDAECTAFFVQVGYKLGIATPTLLYGYNNVQNDRTAAAGDDVDLTTTMMGLYVQIPVAKTFMINPEIMVYDYDDGGKPGTGATVDYGKQTIVGVQFMIVF